MTEGEKQKVVRAVEDYLLDPVTGEPTPYLRSMIEAGINRLVIEGNHEVKKVNNGDRHFVGTLILDMPLDFLLSKAPKAA